MIGGNYMKLIELLCTLDDDVVVEIRSVSRLFKIEKKLKDMSVKDLKYIYVQDAIKIKIIDIKHIRISIP